MSDYKNPIKVRTEDPICTASALGNAIIGILFDKKGSEIKTAITSRVKTIDAKVQECGTVIKKIEGFIEDKKKIVKEMDDYNQERRNKKEALLKPFNRHLDEIRKDFNDKIDVVHKKMNESSKEFEKETLNKIGEEAKIFEGSFDIFKGTFSEIDEFLKKEGNRSEGYSGWGSQTGFSGISGYSGYKGEPLRGVGYGDSVTSNDGSAVYTINSTGNIGTGSSPSAYLNVYSPTEEDEATSRLSSLRSLMWGYSHKIDCIKNRIKQLNEEKRRLELIANNISPDREYKLDLNKLSAFGFEDLV